jgi:DNA-binding NtrC family response regulator
MKSGIGEMPHGQPRHGPNGFSVYGYSSMRDKKTSKAGGSASARARRGTHPPRRILIVDDDDDSRRFNTEVLIHSGYNVDTAEDGAVAWNTLQLKSYDLLITDNKMPKVSGVELLKKLHAVHMALPVIMATGTSPEEEFTRHPWLQPAAILLKPFTNDQLLETVQQVLRALAGRSSGRPPDEACRQLMATML